MRSLAMLRLPGGRFRLLTRVLRNDNVPSAQSMSTNTATDKLRSSSSIKDDPQYRVEAPNADVTDRSHKTAFLKTEGIKPAERIHLDFGDAQKAFKAKSTAEIFRALVVLKVCSYNYVVDNSVKLMELSQKLLGKKLSDFILKSTFYGQFVAGENTADVKSCSNKLRGAGISSMVSIPLEEDVGETKGDREAWYEENIKTMMKCVDQTLLTSDPTCSRPLLMQIRLSPLVSPEVLVKIGQMIIEDGYNYGTDGPISVQHFAKGLQQNGEMNVILPRLNDEENQHINKSLQRLDRLVQYAVDNKTKVFVDAEYTYLRPAMTLIILALMYKYNRPEPYVGNTYQSYLKASRSNICRDIDIALKLGFGFGIKLVRGAYMDKERARAKTMGYEDPINETYEDTNTMYNSNLEMMLDLISQYGKRINMVTASHNEISIKLATEKMHQLGIGPQDGTVVFAQLLGMCDQVSYALGQAGYLIYKSVPVGTVDEVIPYLSRRASENRSVLDGARREQQLLWDEFKRRMKMVKR